MMKYLIKYYVRKELLNLKGSNLGQILRADKTGFLQTRSHITKKYVHNQVLQSL